MEVGGPGVVLPGHMLPISRTIQETMAEVRFFALIRSRPSFFFGGGWENGLPSNPPAKIGSNYLDFNLLGNGFSKANQETGSPLFPWRLSGLTAEETSVGDSTWEFHKTDF